MVLRDLVNYEVELRNAAENLRAMGCHDAALRTEEAAEAVAVAKVARVELCKVWERIEWAETPEDRRDVERLVEQWRKAHPQPEETPHAWTRVGATQKLWELEREARSLRAAVAKNPRLFDGKSEVPG